MPLKRMAEFKREDYLYTSPDGDKWEITIVQTSDRKYVEIRRGEDEQVQWDVEMLLDIADAVRNACQQPKSTRAHGLKKPSVIDHRESTEGVEVKNDQLSPSEAIQASVEEAMTNIDITGPVVESLSQDHAAQMTEDIARRSVHGASTAKQIRRK